MDEPTCLADDCGKGAKAPRGLCWGHYQWLRRHGTLDGPAKRPEVCAADDCGEKPRARGLCTKHYQRWRKRDGDLSDPVKLTPEESRAARLAAQKRHRAKNRERLNAQRRAYREANLERERERARQWHLDHPGVNVANTREWRARNIDRVRDRNRQWYAANKDWSAASSAKRRALERATAVEPVDYAAILAEHGMVCHLCGAAIESRADLHMDHVIPLARGGPHVAENIRPSHRWCNQRKKDRLAVA